MQKLRAITGMRFYVMKGLTVRRHYPIIVHHRSCSHLQANCCRRICPSYLLIWRRRTLLYTNPSNKQDQFFYIGDHRTNGLKCCIIGYVSFSLPAFRGLIGSVGGFNGPTQHDPYFLRHYRTPDTLSAIWPTHHHITEGHHHTCQD